MAAVNFETDNAAFCTDKFSPYNELRSKQRRKTRMSITDESTKAVSTKKSWTFTEKGYLIKICLENIFILQKQISVNTLWM